MKRMRMLLTMLCALLLLGGCKKDPEISFDQFEITDELVLSPSGATIRGTYSFPVVIKGMKARVTEGDTQVGEYAAVLDGNRFTVEIGGLRPDTKYHYRYCVDYGAAEEGVTEARSFTTLSVTTVDDMPVVRTLEVLAIDSTTCRVKCEVTSGGSTPLVERGICWNTTGNPTMDDAVIQGDTAGLGEYMTYMEQLASGKRYYVRAYARNATDVVLGNVLDFEMTALPGMPVNIQVSSNPEEGGTATGGGTYETGTTCTVEAAAAMGYHFVNWTENGNQVWSEPTYTFPVTVERNIVANFSAEAYVISVRIEPEEGGTATGAGGYSHGDTCTLVASPRMGYEFVEWTLGGNTVSTEAEYSFVVTSSATYTARFQVKNYTISVAANPEEGGRVSGGGVFSYGTSCTVHATAADGYAFEKWTDEGDEVSREADYPFVVTGNRHLVAHFIVLQPNEYNINVSANPTEGGQVTGGGVYQEGQECTVRATANAGYDFVSWTENGETVSEEAAYIFTVTRSRTLVANFTPQAPSEYTITVEADPQEGGTVAGGGTYQQGEQCEVRAVAAEGYAFVGWTEGGDTLTQSATYSFIVTRDRSLVAHFSHLEQYVITATADPTEGGIVTGGGTYQQGQSCTLTAAANANYTFDHWTRNGTTISGGITITFNVTENAAYVAHFTLLNYIISVSANPTDAGSVTGGGSYNYGQVCTVKANATNAYYRFVNWTENGGQVSANAEYTFTVDFHRTLVANFEHTNPLGTINGLFTINSYGDQVYFSQGNLQYQASTNIWRFASNQYDYIGNDNTNISSTYSGWIDLFGWGTSGWNCGNTYYRPWDSDNSCDACYGPPGRYDLTGTYANADWGVYNTIYIGSTPSSGWRTLSSNWGDSSEWFYVFNGRNTSSGIRYAKAQVAGVYGVILLPDDWSTSYYNSLNNTNSANASFNSNVISSSIWINNFEAHGAVFLPAAGYRNETSVYSAGLNGVYWSTTDIAGDGASAVFFNDALLNISQDHRRYYGVSVRLVYPAE